jgi:hypothetical protein
VLSRSVALAVALVVTGCSSSGDSGDDPSSALAERVREALQADPEAVADRLDEQGLAVDADDLATAELTCPDVREPMAGDVATCTAEIAGEAVAVDIEFGDGGDLTVVAVEAAP